MSTQRKLLAVLLVIAAGLAVLLAIALRRPVADAEARPEREKPPAPRREAPSEPAESSESRSSLPTAERPASSGPRRVLGAPVKLVGRIGDGRGGALEGTQVLVYDSRGETHKPEVLRPDWYECSLQERGRALVVARRDGHIAVEIPLELFEPDVERHVDLQLPAQPQLRIHVRDLEGKPLPRFHKEQPLEERLRVVATHEELPAELPAAVAAALVTDSPEKHLGWSRFAREELLDTLTGRAGLELRGSPRNAKHNRRRSSMGFASEIQGTPVWDLDEETFAHGIAAARAFYKHAQANNLEEAESGPVRQFLSALGYIGADGNLIEGESPLRDLAGTLTLEKPLPLRVSVFAGQRRIATGEPIPGTEDLSFRVDPAELRTAYVHTYLFASDAQSGARLPGARVDLHIAPLPGGPEQPEWISRDFAQGMAGQEPPQELGAPAGWRYPETVVTTDLDGRADFFTTTPGWHLLTIEAEGHVRALKWVRVERGPECYLGFFALAPLATSRLAVVGPGGARVQANFVVEPLLHAHESEGTLERWRYSSNEQGELVLRNIGRQQLLLRTDDTLWAMEPLLLDNAQGLVDGSPVEVAPSRHVLLHLPAHLPWDAIVHVAQGLTRPVYEESFGGKTLLELWLRDGTYTLRVSEGVTALLTVKFTVAGEPQLVEIDR